MATDDDTPTNEKRRRVDATLDDLERLFRQALASTAHFDDGEPDDRP